MSLFNDEDDNQSQMRNLLGKMGMKGVGNGIGSMPKMPNLENFSDQQIMKYLQENPQIMEMLTNNKEFKDLLQKSGGSNQHYKYKALTSEDVEKCENLESYLDEEGGIYIQPSKGFVFKALDKHREKIFINVVKHVVIDKPEEKDLVDLDNELGVRIPMSVGNLKESHDKKGGACKVVDVIMNPTIVEAAKKELQLRQFLAELLKSYMFEKYKVELKGNFIIPKLQYKGQTVECQRVKGKKLPKIQTINETRNDEQQSEFLLRNKDAMFNRNGKLNKLNQPEFDIFTLNDSSTQNQLKLYQFDQGFEHIKYLVFKFKLPILVTGRFIQLEVSENELFLFTKSLYQIILKLPVRVDHFQSTAKFNVEERALYVFLIPNVMKEQFDQSNKNKIRDDLPKPQLAQNVKIEIKNDYLSDLL